MPDQRPALTRADVPAEFTPETIRELPISILRRFGDHRNGVLTRDEQRAFDRVMHEVMRDTAGRVSQQLTRTDWSAIRREDATPGGRGGRSTSRADAQLRRLARRIGQQVEVAETLAPNVDWSFAQAQTTAPDADPARSEAASSSEPATDPEGTVSDLEQRITEQVELVEVMSEIAEMSKRTYALEQQRDLQTTRGVFFGFVVSVAVLVAGWAPLVAAQDWRERGWIIGLTLGTVLLAAAVYALVRQRQKKSNPASTDSA